MIPEHMREDAELYRSDTYSGWSPEYYEENECINCLRPIYRYKMDLVVEWKHFNHRPLCGVPTRAEPKA